MLKIILLIIYIATILAVIFIERKNPTEAMLWVLVMVCIPYLGVLLYLVFGSTTAIKLTSVVRRKRPVSYTHLDVYKRQGVFRIFRQRLP